METVHGAEGWRLAGDRVSLHVTRNGAHVAPVEFRLGGRTVSPFALAPWTPDEVEAGQPVLLKVLRGDFFCLPFGPQDEGPYHGDPANAAWREVELGVNRLHLSLDASDSGARIEKILTLRDGETAIYHEFRISGLEGSWSYGNHPILDFSDLEEGAGRVSTSPIRWATVYDGVFSDPAKREYQALKESARFDDLGKVPLATGGTTDLTRYPARQGFEDLVMLANEAATDEQPFAWSAAVLDGYVWFSLKNPADFPATLLWISNGGRHAPPWSGRHFARLGIEEVCSHSCDSVIRSRAGGLAEEGIATTREFRRDETVSLRIIQAVAAVPDGFSKVAAIRPDGAGRVVIRDDSGRQVTAALDWSHVL